MLIIFVGYTQFPLIKNSLKQTDKNLQPLTLQSLDGSPYIFPTSKKEIVIYWATWCGPCHIQLSLMDKVIRDNRLKERILAISVGEPISDVLRFLKKNPLPFKVLIDSDNQIRSQLNILATPSLAIIDKENRVEYFTTGISLTFPLRALFY